MVDVLTQIIIACSKEKVSEYAANPDHAPEWYVNIKAVEWKTPKPLQVGSRITFTAQFLRQQLTYMYEIVTNVPGQKLVMRTAEGPFPMETTYTWETVNNDQTRMTLQNKGNPTGFSRLFAPFMAAAIKRANKKDLHRLKQLLENRN